MKNRVKILIASILIIPTIFFGSPVYAFLGQYLGASSATTLALYRFEGNSTDSSGNSRNGTDSNMSYGQAYGKLSQGAHFSGSSSKITATALGTMTSFTVAFWFKSTTAARGAVINQAVSGGSSYSWVIYTDASKLILYLKGSGGGEYIDIESPTSIMDGNWHKVVFTITPGTGSTMYIDGNYYQYQPANATINTFSRTLYIGYSEDTYWGYGVFDMDDLVIEKNVLWSVSKVQKDYTYSKGRFGIN